MTTASTPAVRQNPFPGLRPFREDEEYLFFGRESQIDAMVDRLAATHFLAVVGESGSGKSSLVNCGLRPALHAGLMASAGTAWRMAQFRPGSDPVGALARALAVDGVLFRDYQADGLTLAEIVDTTLRMSSLGLIDIFEQAQLEQGANLVVVVDQFEELFRYRQIDPGRDDATAFVNLLLEAAKQTTFPIYVVLTMRSDFLGDCAQFGGLAEAINAGQYLVPRMTREERRAAISGPVGVAGVEISPVLLTRLVNDVGDIPDQLSILQHALNRTWARWQYEGASGPLNLSQYEAIGTMAHALDQHAELAYGELGTAQQQQICKKLFQALTDKASDVRGVRRPTSLQSLCALADATEAEVAAVIDLFREPSRSFLMPPSHEALQAATVIDISHESLMRVWQRLKKWADQEAASARMYRRLAETAVLHAAGDASLWRDPDLQLALDWRDQSEPNEVWASRYDPGFSLAMRFLTQSCEAREAEQAEREAQRRRELEAEQEKAEVQARYARRMRWWALFSGGLALVALVAAGTAFKATMEAERQTVIAKSGLLANASLLSRSDRPDRAARLGIEAVQTDNTFAARNALLLSLQSNPRLETILDYQSQVLTVAIAPDGKTLASGDDDNTVRLWRLGDDGWTPLGEPLTGHQDRVTDIAFAPDGTTLASASWDKTVQLWQLSEEGWRQPGESLKGHTGRVNSVAFAPDGKTLASASDDDTVRLWPLGEDGPFEPDKPSVLEGHGNDVTSVAFAPDGRTLASGSWDKTVRLWQLGEDGTVAPGAPLVLEGPEHRVTSVAFSPDGNTLASGSWDYTVRLWKKLDGQSWEQPGESLKGHGDVVTSVAFAPGGETLASGSWDKTVRLWQLDRDGWKPRRGEPLQGHDDAVAGVAFGPDGKTLASVSWDNSVRLWELDDRGATAPVKLLALKSNKVKSVAYAPDGKTLASGGNDNAVRLWQLGEDGTVASGEPLVLEGHEDWVSSIAFAPDGKTLASGSDDDTVRLWQLGEDGTVAPGEPPVLEGHDDNVTSVAFAPDGKTLASGSDDNSVRLWPLGEDGTVAPGAQLFLQGHQDWVNSVAFAPDGKTLASASDDDTVRLWPLGEGGRFASGEPSVLQGHADDVTSVAFAPDGKTLASGSDDNTVRLWQLDDNGVMQPGQILQGHSDNVTHVVFAPNGKTLASGSDDATVRLWQLDEGRWSQLGEPLKGDDIEVSSIAFAPDGSALVFANDNNTVWRWDARIESWLTAACGRALRSWPRISTPSCRTDIAGSAANP